MPAEGAAVTEMPAEHLFQLGRCVFCYGRPTVVAPGTSYWRADGTPVSIPACADHHKVLVRYVHQVAMRADLAASEEWI
ncbi:hypothetical protein [Kitasatospora sp. NPDC096204]|uniref:hypothetical protein n=1 Tax=Kitasatospora sp. NPDC096204 TaxID=3364094 RepID=UPI0037FEE3F9